MAKDATQQKIPLKDYRVGKTFRETEIIKVLGQEKNQEIFKAP